MAPVELWVAVAIAASVLAWLLVRGNPISGHAKIVYLDKDAPTWKHDQIPLQGRPDAVIKSGSNVTPVEIKSRKYRGQVYANEALQIAAAGLLIESRYGRYPSYGLIIYADNTRVPIRLGPRAKRLAEVAVKRRIEGSYRVPVKANARCRSCSAKPRCQYV